MSDPIPLLRAVPNQPVPEIVTYLERLLQRARDGDVQALAFALRTADGSFDTWWVSSFNGVDFTLATGIARLAWRHQNEAFSEVAEYSDAPA